MGFHFPANAQSTRHTYIYGRSTRTVPVEVPQKIKIIRLFLSGPLNGLR